MRFNVGRVRPLISSIRLSSKKSGFYREEEHPVYRTADGRKFEFKHGPAPASALYANRRRGYDLGGWRLRIVDIGCYDRPFYLLVIQRQAEDPEDPYCEQLGCYDPLPNRFGERLMAINVDRVKHWLAEGAEPSKSVRVLLGLGGVLPVHPKSFLAAWRRRSGTTDDTSADDDDDDEQTASSL